VLKLFLDEHVSPAVMTGLRRREPRLVIRSMPEWENGTFLGQEDSLCLQAAFAQSLTLVTYDRRSIPPLLKRWAEEAKSHSGVIFVDEKTISPADIGGLVKALDVLVKQTAAWDWTDRVVFLRA
jgi:hypothetical protein